jgi:3-oxoacyl-[acyl-carrier protein] reductase
MLLGKDTKMVEGVEAPLNSKTALITGANGGIGREIAVELATKGLNLVLCTRSINKEWKEWTQQLAKKENVTVKLYQFDFTNQESVSLAAKSILGEHKVDYLVNCAGMPFGATVAMTRIDDLRLVLNVNFVNQVLFTQYFLKGMYSRRNGVIVNIASMSGLNSENGTLAYGASKAALLHFTKVLATESGRFGVRVNAICPGAIQTKMLDSMEKVAHEKIVSQSALGRVGRPTEVAQTVQFLISDSSSYLSGQAIQLNGG